MSLSSKTDLLGPVPPPDAADPSAAAPAWLRRPLARVLFLVGMFLLLNVVQGLLLLGGASQAPPGLMVVVAVVGAAAALAVYVLGVRLVERRPVVELDRRAAASGLARGALLGLLLFSVVIGLIAAVGSYRVLGPGSTGGLLAALALAVIAAVVEELAFRGVLFRVLEELTGTWIALGASAVLFGAVHLANEDATLWGAVAIAVEAGLLLGAAYVATRRLWVPIGLHLAWNFSQAGIFGVPLSGTGQTEGLLESESSGPAVLSGGAFGAEASIFAVLVCLALTAVFVTGAVRGGQIRPPRWSRTPTG